MPASAKCPGGRHRIPPRNILAQAWLPIQMGTEKESVAIDPFAFDSLEPLKELFTNKKIVKLFHAASQDLEIIHHELGVLVS